MPDGEHLEMNPEDLEGDQPTMKLPAARLNGTSRSVDVQHNPTQNSRPQEERNANQAMAESITRVSIPETPAPATEHDKSQLSLTGKQPQQRTAGKKKASKKGTSQVVSHDLLSAQAMRERCRQICATIFFRERSPAHSLGFTSAVGGEGKTLLAMVTASVLANDSSKPVTLLECTWERPRLHEHFGLDRQPGLAEWIRGECSEEEMRHRITENLTVIPAGDDKGHAMRLIHQMHEKDLFTRLRHGYESFIVDLPAVVTSGYGTLAASLVDALIVVVHAGVTPDVLVGDACSQLKELPVQGILLNQIESRIPRWIRQML